MNKKIINETKDYIKGLKLSGIRGDLETKIAYAYKNDEPYEEIIRDIFRQAYDVRKENGRKRRIRNAKFPYMKYLEDLEKDYLPEAAQKKLKELSSLRFIEEKRNIIFSGPPGTGNYRKFLLMERNKFINLYITICKFISCHNNYLGA